MTSARDPLLLEIAAAIGAGGITIGPIHDDDELVHGNEKPDGRVKINPVIHVCDVTVHELLHRLRPDWTERAVRSKTTRLIRQMSYKELDKLYELVLAKAHTTRKAEK